MEDELILDLRKSQVAQVKTDILLDILAAIREIDAIEKFDLESNAISKLNEIVKSM